MMRLNRLLPAVALACAAAVPLWHAAPALAQPAEGPTLPNLGAAGTSLPKPAGTALADTPLVRSAEDFYHYAKVGRYDLALVEGNKLLEGGSNRDVYQALKNVTDRRGEDPSTLLLRLMQLDPAKNKDVRDVAVKLQIKIRGGVGEILEDATFIDSQIRRLSVSERGYQLGITELRRSGELVVPYMLNYLRDPKQKDFHPSIRRALVDLGRQALNPLVAATEMKDQDTTITVVNVLAAIGYDAGVPYIARLAAGPETPAPVKDAAEKALARMGATDAKGAPGRSFFDLAEKFYYNNASIAADKRNPSASIWTWNETKGILDKSDVPPAIFNDLMAMRACEYALTFEKGGDTIALWLAANFKREAEMPEGQKDPINDGKPTADYYGKAHGVAYLQKVVARALTDRNSSVVLKSIKSLAEVAGPANLFNGENQPMTDALSYPDRLVRFEAAFALATALPQANFGGKERVVPILADALAQNGKPNVLVLASSQDQLNGLLEAFKTANYFAQGGTNPSQTLASAAALPGVDAIVISEKVDRAMVDQMMGIIAQTPRLERAPRVFVVASNLSPYASQAVSDPLTNVVKGTTPETLAAAVQSARTRSGSLPLDEKSASEYALRAADLLYKLAISRGQVFDLIPAEATLRGSLDDSRPDVAKAVSKVVGLLDSPRAQQALLNKAVDEKTADDLKVADFQALATSARFYQNRLEPGQLEALEKAVQSAPNLDVRAAAAAARGALNIPPALATQLIIDQSRVPTISKKPAEKDKSADAK